MVENQDVGRALREPALVASLPEPASGLRPTGDDPARIPLHRRLWFRLRALFTRVTCAHEWEDGWTFANCVEVTIPSGNRRAVSWQVMQFCAHCDAMQRRQLTREEYTAQIDFLERSFRAGEETIYAEDLPTTGVSRND